MYLTKHYFVYIMASDSGTIYIGVTNNILKRACEHREGFFEGFTKKYNCKKVIYIESYSDVVAAIAREKQLKRWSRTKKESLIKTQNPRWRDLSASLEMTGLR